MSDDAPTSPYATTPDGVRVAVRLTPRAKRNEVTGLSVGADGRSVLAIRLAAPPVDGAANKALIAFLADVIGLPKSAVTIRSGETARVKMLHLAGDPAVILERLGRIAGSAA